MKKSRITIIIIVLLCVLGSFGRKREPKPQPDTVEATMGERTVTIRDWTPKDAPVDQEAIDRALAAFPEPTPTPSPSRAPSSTTKSAYETKSTYILNTDKKTFHRPGCSAADRIKSENRDETTALRDSLIDREYTPCGICNP